MCVQPFSPACVDQPATYQKAEKVSACQRELDAYAAATAAYRDCLQRQIADAVRQANDVLRSLSLPVARRFLPVGPPSIRERPDAPPRARWPAPSHPEGPKRARPNGAPISHRLARSTLTRAGNRDPRDRPTESGPRTRGSHPDIAVGVDDDARVPAGTRSCTRYSAAV